MGVAISDAAVQIIGACVHAVRFTIGTPLDYPYAVAGIATTNPPPALYRRVQVVSPPPTRGGEPWQTGMTLDDKPFQPDALAGRLDEVRLEEGCAALDFPDPGRIVLDRWLSIPRQRTEMVFPGPNPSRSLPSVHYWNPVAAGSDSVIKQVEYHGTYRLEFDRRPVGDWIAVSMDNFWPPERDSADLIVPLGECDGDCRS